MGISLVSTNVKSEFFIVELIQGWPLIKPLCHCGVTLVSAQMCPGHKSRRWRVSIPSFREAKAHHLCKLFHDLFDRYWSKASFEFVIELRKWIKNSKAKTKSFFSKSTIHECHIYSQFSQVVKFQSHLKLILVVLLVLLWLLVGKANAIIKFLSSLSTIKFNDLSFWQFQFAKLLFA